LRARRTSAVGGLATGAVLVRAPAALAFGLDFAATALDFALTGGDLVLPGAVFSDCAGDEGTGEATAPAYAGPARPLPVLATTSVAGTSQTV
jgi:hypothetical protein